MLLLVVSLGAPPTVRAAAEPKGVVKCQAMLKKAGAKFIGKKLGTLAKCTNGVFKCVQTIDESGDAGVKRTACITKARGECLKALASITSARQAYTTAVATTCAALDPGQVAGANGLGWATADCSEFGTVVTSVATAAECLARQHNCLASRLFQLTVPRALELMQFTPPAAVAIPVADADAVACLEDTGGSGGDVGDVALGKAIVKCQTAIEKVGAKLALGRLKVLEKCVDALFACAQTKTGDDLAACRAKVQARCDKSFAKGEEQRAALAASLEKPCGDQDLFAAFRTAVGGNLLALLPSAFVRGGRVSGCSGLVTIADYQACLLQGNANLAVDLLRFEAPRADTLLEEVGCNPDNCAALPTPTPSPPPGPSATGPTPTLTPVETATEVSVRTPTPDPTPTCHPLRATCDDEAECCQDGATTCDELCCHFAQEGCSANADCCTGASCREGFCCVNPGSPCDTTDDCCLTGFEGECDNGTCVAFCRGKDAQCDDPSQCCGGDQCIGGRCRPPGCLPAGYTCADVGQCCEVEQSFCGDTVGAQPACCHPNGGSCAETRDCCGESDCCGGSCCGPDRYCCPGAGGCCQSNATCCGNSCCPPGRECCGGTTCCPEGQFCSGGQCVCLTLQSPCEPTNNVCCQFEPTSCLATNASAMRARRCCRPKGGSCTSNFDCCSTIFHNFVGPCSQGVCGGDSAACSFHEDCVSGHCYGHCSNVAPVQDCFTDTDCPSNGICIEKGCRHCPTTTRPCGDVCCGIGRCCDGECC